MLKLFGKSLNNRKGFTLIELIVVIAVLGILAAVALPRISGVTSTARDNADAEQVRILNEAVERYVAETGDDDFSDIDSDTASEMIESLVAEGYLKAGVTDELPSGEMVGYSDASGLFND